MSGEAMLYDNRELSFLKFNARVLSEAENPRNPLLERARFLSIVSSNLDEFFMVRIAALREKVLAGKRTPDAGGLSPETQLKQALAAAGEQRNRQYTVYNTVLLPLLAEAGLRVVSAATLEGEARAAMEAHFDQHIAPLLTAYRADQVRAFPLLLSRTINVCAMLGAHGEKGVAVFRVPPQLPRVTWIDERAGQRMGVLIEDEIACLISRVLPEDIVHCCQPFRLTRDADSSYADDEQHDLLAEMEKSLRRRKWGSVTRLELCAGTPGELRRFLERALRMDERAVYASPGPVHLDFLGKQICGVPGMDEHRFAPFTPYVDGDLSGRALFSRIAQGDQFFYHPYDSFEPVVRLVSLAADDPNVVSIKQTLYRVSAHSPIVAALARAAQKGKQVTVLIEVRARFDEENNIGWGRQLEAAGCHVVYGLPRLKTHAKILLITRRESGVMRRYLHLGTGNYNDSTAKVYTDMGIMTTNETLCADGEVFFARMLGYKQTRPMEKLIQAPDALRAALTKLIQREIEHAQAGRPAGFTAKMNALVDPGMIALIYRASQAGVPVRLIVRGACCLRPGVKGVSELVSVRSIVGRYLEHARVYMFRNGGMPEVYLSSADLMKRNLDRRVELMFPILDRTVARQVASILTSQLCDTQLSWSLDADGEYRRVAPSPGAAPYSTQEAMMTNAPNESAE